MHRKAFPGRFHRSTITAAALILALPPCFIHPQNTDVPPDNAQPFKLRVFTDLVQTPALVVPPYGPPYPHFEPRDFNMRFDSGPVFHPIHARLEGDDPITLSILIDTSGNEGSILRAFQKGFAQWIKASLKPHDHVSIFAFDCSVTQTTIYARLQPVLLQQQLDVAINSPDIHGKKTRGACGNSIRLWDSLGAVVSSMTDLPGRRVILAISNGYDGGSKTRLDDLKLSAAVRGVAIFGITASIPSTVRFNTMPNLCWDTGGVLLTTTDDELQKSLATFVDMLRHRYILEYHRSSKAAPGYHSIEVTLRHSDALVLPAGTTVPIVDPSLKDDPSVVLPDPTAEPVMGTKRPARPH